MFNSSYSLESADAGDEEFLDAKAAGAYYFVKLILSIIQQRSYMLLLVIYSLSQTCVKKDK